MQFHSIALSADAAAAVENHRRYSVRRGYAHHRHEAASPGNSARSLLIYKYNLIAKLLAEAPNGEVLAFADQDAVIYTPLDALQVLGNAQHWIVENAHTRRPEGNFLILRAGEDAVALVRGILERLRTLPESYDRWAHHELEGVEAHPHDRLIDGRHYPNFLFASFGQHLPEVSAFVLSLNPTVHPNAYDARVQGIFIEYLNRTQERGARLYDDLPAPPPVPDYEVRNPGRPIALLTSYTPHIENYAMFSEQNITQYALRHGYTHHIYRDLPSELRGSVAGNWVKARLLLQLLDQHEQVAWVDADILIHDLAKPLASIMRGAAMALARDISGHLFNSGFMVFSNTPLCRAYLAQVQAMIDAVDDKSGVYASGGDQTVFTDVWRRLGGERVMPLSDCVSFNSHPALYDRDTFMLHYMGYPDRLRAVVMRHDAMSVEQRESAVHSGKPEIAAELRPRPRLHFTHALESHQLDQFGDILNSFVLAAQSLGFETSVAPGTLDPQAVNIVLFAWRVRWPALAEQHPRCIVVNFEHLTPGNFCFSESYREVLRHCYLWDYSLSNLHKNLALGMRATDHVPLAHQAGAAPELPAHHVLPDSEQDIDVVFFGATTERRVRVLNELIRRGVRVVTPAPQPWSNAERDAYLLRAKLVLNIHQLDDSRVVEVHRLMILFRQRKAVVCELYPDSDIDFPLRAAVEGAPYEALVDTTLRLLGDPARRAELERKGHDCLARRSQAGFLGPALERYLQWLAQQQSVAADPPARPESPRVSIITTQWPADGCMPFLLEQDGLELECLYATGAQRAGSLAPVSSDITTIVLPGRANQALAYNAALRQAQGDYIVFWETGDIWQPDRLLRLSRFLQAHPEIDVVGSWLDSPAGASLSVPELDHEIRAELLGTQRVLQARSCMFRRSFLQQHRLEHDVRFGSHAGLQHLLHRCTLAGARLAAIPAALITTAPPGPQGAGPTAVTGEERVAMQRDLLSGYFPTLTRQDHAQLALMHADHWPPDASFASRMLALLARAAGAAAASMRLEPVSLTRTLRQEAVRLLLRYREAGLVDGGWLADCLASPELAGFLAPARDALRWHIPQVND